LNALRRSSVPLRLNAVVREKAEAEVSTSNNNNYVFRVAAEDVAVVERFYPRRHRYLTLANLSATRNVTVDLSSTYFGGRVLVASPAGALSGYVRLDRLQLQPRHGLVLLLDK